MPARPQQRAGFPALALLCAAAAFPTVAAGNGETSWDSDRTLESVIVTATRMERSILEVTEAVSAVDAGQIRNEAPELLAEMLRGIPGTFFQQTTPGQGIPIIRGLKGSQVLHLVDGMRLNNAFFRDAPNQYLGLVDAYAAERTEVIRGSAPSLYGADAMGGVVQVLTAEPQFEGDQWAAEGRVYAAYQGADDGLIGRFEAATGRSGTVLSGGATFQDRGDRTTGGGVTVHPSGYRSNAADLKWRQAIGERSELMLAAQYLEQPSTPRVDELVPGYGQDHAPSELYEFMPNRREFLHARYRLDSDSRWFSRLQANLARQVITDDRLTRDFASPWVNREFNASELDGLTVQLNSPWRRSAVTGELVWGIEYYRDSVSSSRFREAADGGTPVEVAARFPDGSGMDSAAVYASNQWAWDRLSIDAGVRYSRFEIVLPATAETDAVRLNPDDLTADLHAGYQLSPGLRLVANLGRGFRPPNIFDLGTLGSRPGNRFNIPNPRLQPESVWSTDLGVKMSSGRWQIEAFAWYADYDDKIGSRLTGEVTPEGRLVVRSDNLNEARLYGFESGVRYLADAAVELYAVLNYTRGEERSHEGTSTPADRIPPLSGRLGLVWEPTARWRIEPRLDFAAAQDRLSPRDQEDPRIRPGGTAGWGSVNLLASWQINPATTLGLKLQNLGDKEYREHGSGIDAAGRNLGAWVDVLF